MRLLLRGLGYVLAIFGAIYGEYNAIRFFFDVQICQGGPTTTCQWFFEGWNGFAIALIFSFYIPF